MKARRIWLVLSISSFLIGILLVLSMFWIRISGINTLMVLTDYHPDSFFYMLLYPIVLGIACFTQSSLFFGVAFLLIGIIGIFLTRPPLPDATGFFTLHRFGIMGIGIALIAHISIIVFSTHFLFVSPGAYIRPMGWAMMMALIAGGTFFVVVPLSIIAIIKERPRFLGIIGLILGITPFWFSAMLLNFMSWVIGFNLSD
jgi:hypothetical protein